MPNFETGVSGFLTLTAEIKVNFPIDNNGKVEIACKHCPYLSSNERICQLNKMPVAYPHKYIGANCPLNEEKE